MKACLLEAGYTDEIRHTLDIDANWFSTELPTGIQMEESLKKAVQRSEINLDVKIYRMYGEGRSAGFELKDINTDEVLFTMDIDVNKPASHTKIYEIEGIRFCGVFLYQMIADKLYVISTDKIFRRIKDVVDLYYISKVIPFIKDEIFQVLENNKKELESFNGFLYRQNDLKHSYEKFRFTGDVSKRSISYCQMLY